MSDIPDPKFMEGIVQPDYFPSMSNMGKKETAFSEDPKPSETTLPDDTRSESVESFDITEGLLENMLLHLQAMTVELANQEVTMAEKSLSKYNKILEACSIRNTFRQISLGLQTSLSDLDTSIMKKLQILRMNAADRIAVRPLFHRAGYDVPSRDPPFTRTGLPRAISMSDCLTARSDMSSISSLCLEYPEEILDWEE